MLFSEVYGAYYDCVGAVIAEAQRGTLTDARLRDIVQERAFPESVLEIPRALKSGAWPLLRKDGSTVIRHPAARGLTALEKRWLKSLLTDPRIRLFDVSGEGLQDVEPLFTRDQLVWYDRFTDGDPWEDEDYRRRFRLILKAIREHRGLRIRYSTHRERVSTQEVYPRCLEYSPQDDKLRLLGYKPLEHRAVILNLGRMISCEETGPFDPKTAESVREEYRQAVIELINVRNALERAMLQFSHLAKKTEQLDSRSYRVTLNYRAEDETELLIQLLSFGPVLRVLSPAELAAHMKERILRQLRRETGREQAQP